MVGRHAKLGKRRDLALARMGYFSDVAFECPKCGKDTWAPVAVPEPDFSGDKLSDITSSGEVEVPCAKCDTNFEGSADVSPGHCEIKLVQHPSTTVHSNTPYYDQVDEPDDWELYEVPDDPYQIFQSTIGPLTRILADYTHADTQGLLTRMVFSQAITAFEAYFCDRLIKKVITTPKAMEAILKKDGYLSEARFSLADFLSKPDIIKREIEANLRNRLYHRIDEVARLYANALDISITPSRDDLVRLKTDIGYRHDCVHRNGVDKEGNRLDVLTKEYVSETIKVVAGFARHTENQVNDYDGIPSDDF